MYLASRADSSIGTVPLPTPHAHCLKRMPTCAERSNMHSRRHPRQPHTNALATGLPSRRRRLRCGHCPPPAARRAQVRRESAFPATFRRLPAYFRPRNNLQLPPAPSGLSVQAGQGRKTLERAWLPDVQCCDGRGGPLAPASQLYFTRQSVAAAPSQIRSRTTRLSAWRVTSPPPRLSGRAPAAAAAMLSSAREIIYFIWSADCVFIKAAHAHVYF